MLTGDSIVGDLNGTTLTFQLQTADDAVHGVYRCRFINTVTPLDSVGGGTGTPPSNTLPPTDSAGSSNTPTSDGRLVVAAIFAGILAASLVSIPSLGSSRTASRRR
jgi:hypothetical protein